MGFAWKVLVATLAGVVMLYWSGSYVVGAFEGRHLACYPLALLFGGGGTQLLLYSLGVTDGVLLKKSGRGRSKALQVGVDLGSKVCTVAIVVGGVLFILVALWSGITERNQGI